MRYQETANQAPGRYFTQRKIKKGKKGGIWRITWQHGIGWTWFLAAATVVDEDFTC